MADTAKQKLLLMHGKERDKDVWQVIKELLKIEEEKISPQIDKNVTQTITVAKKPANIAEISANKPENDHSIAKNKASANALVTGSLTWQQQKTKFIMVAVLMILTIIIYTLFKQDAAQIELIKPDWHSEIPPTPAKNIFEDQTKILEPSKTDILVAMKEKLPDSIPQTDETSKTAVQEIIEGAVENVSMICTEIKELKKTQLRREIGIVLEVRRDTDIGVKNQEKNINELIQSYRGFIINLKMLEKGVVTDELSDYSKQLAQIDLDHRIELFGIVQLHYQEFLNKQLNINSKVMSKACSIFLRSPEIIELEKLLKELEMNNEALKSLMERI